MTSQSYSEDSRAPGSRSSSGELLLPGEVRVEKSVWQGCLRVRSATRVSEMGVRVLGEDMREGPVRLRVAAILRLRSVTVALVRGC